jgi:hypothetical protein
MHNIYFILLSILLVSCTTSIRYIGQTRPVTKKVDVYIAEQSIRQEFEYIGKGYISGFGYQNPETIQQRAVQKAKTVGADAVLIKDYISTETAGATVTTVQRSDSIGKSLFTTGNSVISPTVTTGFQILFIKYLK